LVQLQQLRPSLLLLQSLQSDLSDQSVLHELLAKQFLSIAKRFRQR
jgi:hypothetical protein